MFTHLGRKLIISNFADNSLIFEKLYKVKLKALKEINPGLDSDK